MALRSQMARQGIRWRYMAGGNRRRGWLRKWPWALLSLLIVTAVVMAIWMGASPTPGSLEVVADAAPQAGGEADGPGPANYTLPAPGATAPPAASSTTNRTPAAASSASAERSASLPANRVWTLDGNPSPATPVMSPATPAASATPEAKPETRSGALPAKLPGATVSLSTGNLADGFSLIEQGKRVEGRKLLSRLLVEGSLTPAEAQKVRDVLTVVNNNLIYSPRVTTDDPLTAVHVVQRGDRLVNIAIRYKVPHQFVEKINGINADRIQLDQKIKVVRGPFHAVVTKSAYRMDVFLKDPADGQMLYIRSFAVGLGAEDSTPIGQFVVRPRSKVVNPGWTNPRTGETFSRDDPKNPIGEFWMGLEGVQMETAELAGYGIHGTIDQGSVGTQASMGCIRLRDEDIAQVFYMFWEGETMVRIAP